MGNIRSWLEGVRQSDTAEDSDEHGESSDGAVEEDIDRVIRQISLAVSRSRGVSSLSRAVAKTKGDGKYSNKIVSTSASLPRPKLKRLKSANKNQCYNKIPSQTVDKPWSLHPVPWEPQGPTYPDPFYSSAHSPAWILAQKDYFKFSYHQHSPQTQNFFCSKVQDPFDDKKQKKLLTAFCKSICFILLVFSFILVIITVSVLLTKDIKTKNDI